MKALKINFILFSFLFLTITCWCDERLEELDATNIKFTKDKMLVENGNYPRWSPDTKKILYSVLTADGSEIWQMNQDGSNKEFIVKGTHGSWSPDGEKIVYLTKPSWMNYVVTIYDLKKSKILYQDGKEFGLNGPGILSGEFDSDKLYWSGNKIYFISSRAKGFIASGRRIRSLDLDTLEWKSTSESRNKELINELDRNLKLPNLEIVQVPIYVIPHSLLAHNFRYGPLTVPRWLRGIWAVSKRKNFYIRLLKNATQPELHPNQEKMVYVKVFEERGSYRTEIHCLGLTKGSELNRKIYEAELGADDGVKESDALIIAYPKINPLNNKIIGYEGSPKAIVIVKYVKSNRCLVEPHIIIEKFGKGDLAAYEGTKKFGLIKESSEIEFSPEKPKEPLIKKEKAKKQKLITLLKKAQEDITRSKNAFNRNDLRKWADYLVNALKIIRTVNSNLSDYEGLNDNDISTIRRSKEHLEKAREYFVRKNKPRSGYSEMKKAGNVLKNYLKGIK